MRSPPFTLRDVYLFDFGRRCDRMSIFCFVTAAALVVYMAVVLFTPSFVVALTSSATLAVWCAAGIVAALRFTWEDPPPVTVVELEPIEHRRAATIGFRLHP